MKSSGDIGVRPRARRRRSGLNAEVEDNNVAAGDQGKG